MITIFCSIKLPNAQVSDLALPIAYAKDIAVAQATVDKEKHLTPT